MADTVLSLGGVAFRDFEIPEEIGFGGAQRLAVHPLIGGGRVVDALGASDAAICFSGAFSGADAGVRARALDAARMAGAALPLVWGDFYYAVMIADFSARFEKPWWIPFRLRCVVVADPAALAAAIVPAASVIAGDVASATALAGQAGVSLGGLDATSADSFVGISAAIGAATAAAGAALGTSVGALGGAQDAASGVAAMGAIGTEARRLAALAAMNGTIGRAGRMVGAALP